MNEWISVNDRLPSEGGRYLCCYDDGRITLLYFALCLHCVDEYYFDNLYRSGFYNYDHEYGYFEWGGVTHWMLLPEPPKGVKNE